MNLNMLTVDLHKKVHKGEQKTKELLVFGYSCKLFRDDEKAQYIDQGKHLIPWMGDEAVKIDRYDGRGALYDLKQHEPHPGGFDPMISLTNEERRIEQMCDEERYHALKQNEDVDLLYQEEEWKRLQEVGKNKKYGQVGFNYDDENSNDQVGQEEKQGMADDTDDLFVLIPQLDIPVNTVLPTSKKHFAIIEKTASFIHSQGAQMEILLKMKQAGNPQFGFLSFDNPLYPFYRHVLSAIQSGRYLPGTYEQTTATEHNTSSEQDHYLHPSLQVPPTMSVLPESAPSVPSIAYKPSENCAYSMLINKIREKQTILPLVGVEPKTPEASRSPASTVSHSRSNSPSPPPERSSPIQDVSTPDVAAPVVVSKSAVISRAPEYYNPEELASDSEDDSEKLPDPQPLIIIPDPELKLIIDKLVLYVAKNGRDFEIVVKRKCDPRFSFLEPGDKHNPYYESELAKLLPTDGTPQAESTNGDNSQKQSLLRFSIKKPRPDKPIPSADTKVISALEDSSSEDETESNDNNNVPSPPPPPVISEPVLVAPPPPDISDKDAHASSKSNNVNGATSDAQSQIGGAVETDEKKQERKRRAEMFLKMLQKSGEVSATNSQTDTDEVQHIGTVHKVEKKIIVSVINVPDSDDDTKELTNGALPPLDLKAKLKALRTRSKSPVSRTSAPPSKVRKSSHHSRHKRGKSRSRSQSAGTDSDSHRSRGRKKGHRRDPSCTPSPERSRRHGKKSSKSAKKKKKRDDSRSPARPSSKKSKSVRHKGHARSPSHSPSASPKKSKSSKSKRKKRKYSSSDSD